MNRRLLLRFRLLALVSLALASWAAPIVLAEPNWPGFRGRDGVGIGIGDTTPREIAPDKNVKWKVDCPSGASSPCVWGDKIFLTAFDEGKLWTICYAKADGKQLWKVEAPATTIEAYHKTEGSPAASTPATDGTNLVVYFGSCGLICYDFEGNEKWRREMPCAKTNFDFGTGTSPILAGDRVILLRDTATDSSITAYAAANGKQLWTKSREALGTSFGSPCVWNSDGVNEVVVGGALRLKSYDLQTGEERWTIRNAPAAVCTTPITANNMLYFAAWSPGGEDFPMPSHADIMDQAKKAGKEDGDGKLSKEESAGTMLKDFFDNNDTDHDGFVTADEWDGIIAAMKKGHNVAMAIKPGGRGDITDTHVAWQQTKGLPYVPSPVAHQGKMYLIKDGGLLTCFRLEDGKPQYLQARIGAAGSYYASPVIASDRLYVCSLEGEVSVLTLGEKPETLSRAKFGERIFATPAIADNTMYLRTASKLYAFHEAAK